MRTAVLSLIILVSAWTHVSANPFEYPYEMVKWFFCERLGYSKNIEVQVYLLDREQVAEFLDDLDNRRPVQKTEAELFGNPQYLVFKAIDHGHHPYEGTLRFYIEGRYLTSGDSSNYSVLGDVSVLPVGFAILAPSDHPPRLSYMWGSLYVE